MGFQLMPKTFCRVYKYKTDPSTSSDSTRDDRHVVIPTETIAERRDLLVMQPPNVSQTQLRGLPSLTRAQDLL